MVVESVKATQRECAALWEPRSSSAPAKDSRGGGRGGTSSAPSLLSFDSLLEAPLGLTQKKPRRQESLSDTTFRGQPPEAWSIADRHGKENRT